MHSIHRCPFSICLSGTCPPRRPCKAGLCVACAGRLKAADLIDFLGAHAAAAPSKGRAADSSGEADSDGAPGGDESEKAVPQVRSYYKRVFGWSWRQISVDELYLPGK